MYMLDMHHLDHLNVKFFVALSDKSWLWHHRLAHANMDLISKLARKELVIGLPKMVYTKDKLCRACQLGKQTKVSFNSKNCIY